jgi:hypothetical protein
LVIVTTSTRLSPLDCTVLICESFLVSIFKPELSLSHLLALAHLASQSGPAWHVICAGFDNPVGPPPPAQLQAPKRTHAISEFRRTYLITIPQRWVKNFARGRRAVIFTRPPWSDCGRSAGRSKSSNGPGRREATASNQELTSGRCPLGDLLALTLHLAAVEAHSRMVAEPGREFNGGRDDGARRPSRPMRWRQSRARE